MNHGMDDERLLKVTLAQHGNYDMLYSPCRRSEKWHESRISAISAQRPNTALEF